MKTTLTIFLTILTAHAFSRTITVVSTTEDNTPHTEHVIIATNEVVTLLNYGSGQTRFDRVSILKSEKNAIMWVGDTLAGPMEILVEVNPNSWNSQIAMCTLKIEPESFPPDKTILIPAGGGANVGMECSTNLIDWVPANLGVYTNQPAAKFFRLKAERVQ